MIARAIGYGAAVSTTVTAWALLPWGLAAAGLVWCSPVAVAARLAL